MTDDIRRMLGGYATGTLTEDERRALLEASLQDQQLFEALADEEVLRQLLEDPAARAALLQAAETHKFTISGGLREWFERPKAKVLVATACVLLAAIGYRTLTERPAVRIAQVRTPSEIQQVPEVAPAAPQKLPVTSPAPARSAAKKVRPPASGKPLVATAPAPPPAPVLSDSLTRVVEMRPSVIRYTLLRRTETGDYIPVPEDYLFGPADQVRLQVEVNGNGFLAVTDENRAPLYAAQVTSGSPVTVPRTLTVSDRDRMLNVAFTPEWTIPQTQAQAMRNELRTQADEQSPSLRAARSKAAAPAQMERISSPHSPHAMLVIILRHKP